MRIILTGVTGVIGQVSAHTKDAYARCASQNNKNETDIVASLQNFFLRVSLQKYDGIFIVIKVMS